MESFLSDLKHLVLNFHEETLVTFLSAARVRPLNLRALVGFVRENRAYVRARGIKMSLKLDRVFQRLLSRAGKQPSDATCSRLDDAFRSRELANAPWAAVADDVAAIGRALDGTVDAVALVDAIVTSSREHFWTCETDQIVRDVLRHFDATDYVRFEERFVARSRIAQGSYGCVSVATRRHDDPAARGSHAETRVATKEFFGTDGDERDQLREIMCLSKLASSRIARLLEIGVRGWTPIITLELYATDLFRACRYGVANSALSAATRIVDQIAEGVAHIHAHGYMHRDIKLGNVLCDSHHLDTCNVRIADFGFATRCVAGRCNTLSVVTSGYRAPELLLGFAQYTSAIDVWAVGCVFIELLLRHSLFERTKGARPNDELHKLVGFFGVDDVLRRFDPHCDARLDPDAMARLRWQAREDQLAAHLRTNEHCSGKGWAAHADALGRLGYGTLDRIWRADLDEFLAAVTRAKLLSWADAVRVYYSVFERCRFAESSAAWAARLFEFWRDPDVRRRCAAYLAPDPRRRTLLVTPPAPPRPPPTAQRWRHDCDDFRDMRRRALTWLVVTLHRELDCLTASYLFQKSARVLDEYMRARSCSQAEWGLVMSACCAIHCSPPLQPSFWVRVGDQAFDAFDIRRRQMDVLRALDYDWDPPTLFDMHAPPPTPRLALLSNVAAFYWGDVGDPRAVREACERVAREPAGGDGGGGAFVAWLRSHCEDFDLVPADVRKLYKATPRVHDPRGDWLHPSAEPPDELQKKEAREPLPTSRSVLHSLRCMVLPDRRARDGRADAAPGRNARSAAQSPIALG